LVAVGRLIRARGNHGELIGEIYSSQPGRADKLREVTLELSGRQRSVRIETIWMHDGRPIFKFAGIDSIGEAEEWAGADILVSAEQQVRPGEGEFSHADLIGCSVADAAGPIGVVKGIEEYGSAPLLIVEAVDGREVLIPFTRAICREIDVAAKTIRADLPEGLLDL